MSNPGTHEHLADSEEFVENLIQKEGLTDSLSQHVEQILRELGEDPERDGLRRTPERVAKAWQFLVKGYNEDPEEIVGQALFPIDYDEMVIVKDIDFFSLCEHHMLPFYGKCHVAYIPDGKVVGLSKIPRLVEVFSRRLQVQERLTVQLAETIKEILKPKGVGIIMEGYHLCMMMRGVEKQNCYTQTSHMLGLFRKDPRTRSEFLQLVRHAKP